MSMTVVVTSEVAHGIVLVENLAARMQIAGYSDGSVDVNRPIDVNGSVIL